MDTINTVEETTCRELVTKEVLYDRLNKAINACNMAIMREETKLEVLRRNKWGLDEYFEDLDRTEEVNHKDKWHNDTRLASAPEPVLDPSAYPVRRVRPDLIDEMMEYMGKLEEGGDNET